MFRFRIQQAVLSALLTVVFATSALAAERTMEVDVADDRKTSVSIYQPDTVQGVLLFSHGLGGNPDHFKPLLRSFEQDGWLVIAPLHVDSEQHPRHDEFDRRATFIARIADFKAAAELGNKLAPGLPQVAVGHSYGSLFAMMAGGAKTLAGDLTSTGVKAVLAFSTPGVIKGLTSAKKLGKVAIPLMIITGDADVVPGLIADPAEHRAAFDSGSADAAYLIVVAGGEHELSVVTEAPAYAALLADARLFLSAYGLGNKEAKAKLEACPQQPPLAMECR